MRRFFSYTWLLPLVLFQACSPTVKVPSKKAITNQDLPLPSVTISLSSKLLNLDPVKPAPQSDIITIYLTAGRLFKLNRDWSVEPELAESMKVSEDGLEAKVILKEDIVYSDGTKLTSQDVVFAYTRNRDFPGPFFPTLLLPIDSVEAADHRTVIFRLKQPYIDLRLALAHMAMVIHPQSKIENDPDYFLHPVSAGPYVLKKWIPGASTWTIEANPHYVRGAMAINQIELVSVPDPTSRVLQLVSGSIDYVYELPVSAQALMPEEVTTHKVPLNGQYFFGVNHGLPSNHPLRNAKVRQAFSLAINREEINQKAFGGISTPAKGFQYPGPKEGLDNLPFKGRRNLEAARELLAQTPFAKGFRTILHSYGQRPGWTDAALVIASNLKDLGIEVQVSPVEDSVATSDARAGRFEMIFSGNSSGPINFFRNMWIPGTFWAEVLRYNSPEVISLVNAASKSKNFDQRIELIHAAQDLALEEMPIIPVSERVLLVGSRIRRDILFEENLPPGTNPMVATISELQGVDSGSSVSE